MRVLVALIFFGMTSAQRPFYAGNRPIGRPELATRFKENSTTETPQTSSTLANRVGESEITTNKIPVDARGDGQLVDRLNQWPREHRPFWLLNAEHIEASRKGQQQQNNIPSDNATGQSNSQQLTNERSSFNNFQDDQPDFESYYEAPRQSSRPINSFGRSRSSFLGPLQT